MKILVIMTGMVELRKEGKKGRKEGIFTGKGFFIFCRRKSIITVATNNVNNKY